MNKIIVITGQTATGKTKLALQYANKYNGELINCDSRQIYKYLDVITGKDIKANSKPQLKSKKFVLVKKLGSKFDIGFYPISTNFNQFQPVSTKLWLFDVAKPDEYFSSFDFVQLAIPVINDILKRGKTPIIVGGTYLYLKHLLYGVETESIPPNWKLRKKLAGKTIAELQNTLKSLNPSTYIQLNNSDRKNPQRLIRKIEIAKCGRKVETGHAPSLPDKLNIPNLKIKFLGLKFKNKEVLIETIKKRVEERLKNGAIEEVKRILKMGYKPTDPGLKTIGYQQILSYLSNQSSLNKVLEEWINKEIQYAKRQYTFMKKDENIKWKEI